MCGWETHNVILIHPDTLSALGSHPRQPCILIIDSKRSLRTLWPCEEVSLLRANLEKKFPVDQLIRILPIHSSDIRPLSRISLQPTTTDSRLSSTHFKDYANAFLSNAFLSPQEIIEIPYFGDSYSFSCNITIDEALGLASLTEETVNPQVWQLKPKCDVQIQNEPLCSTGADNHKLEFCGYGGAQNVKNDLQLYLIRPLQHKEQPCSVILCGMSGCGKSLLVDIVGSQLGQMAVRVNNADELDRAMDAVGDSPVALIIDSFEVFKLSASDQCEEKLARFMDERRNVAVLLTVRQVESISLPLRRRFPLEMELSVPSLPERREILRIILRENVSVTEDLINSVAQETHGFTGSDLASLCRLAQFDKSGVKSLGKSFDEARRRIRPTGIRQFLLEVPNVRWDDIGGNEELKLEIQQAVIWPQLYADRFLRFGIDPPSGILLYGPPGCSKTLVARALASQSRLNFLAVKGPELFSKWVGESEKAVRELFRRARQVAPTILFFDELDAMAVARGDKSQSGVGDRVLAQLLTEIDGLERKSGVLVLAATNRPDILDDAILRPGRIDRAIYVPLPNPATRRAILQMHIKRLSVGSDVSLDALVTKTEGYSGAELVALCRNAALIALREDINVDCIREHHFEKSLKIVVPRTDRNLLDIYERFQKGIRVTDDNL
ncbi:hypothetical protein AB6A40_000252 [Gnathostoma spinigerum]|uniref:AAA+ ATPase domain-containing protein n=1 Tax=Gnathostoma spinigerum TaxID=75299 RepID=A0ABD6E9Y5_9BILA